MMNKRSAVARELMLRRSSGYVYCTAASLLLEDQPAIPVRDVDVRAFVKRIVRGPRSFKVFKYLNPPPLQPDIRLFLLAP